MEKHTPTEITQLYSTALMGMYTHTHIGRVREARAHAFSWAHAEAHDALNFA